MRKQRRRPRRRRATARSQGEPFANEQAPARVDQAKNKQGPFYRAGPVFNLGTVQIDEGDKAEKDETAKNEAETDAAESTSESTEMEATAAELLEEEEAAAGPAPTASGEGAPAHSVAFARTSVTLRGRTDAEFDGGSFRTENVRVRRAQGCEGCTDECVRVTGTLVATYQVTTTVTLPSVDDFPDLTPCQRRRVQHAIDNVLAPHEQEHVRAFERYNGTTRRRFNLTLCRSDFDSRIQQMFETEEASRRQTAQAASDALDPFHFEVDLDCEDEEQSESAAPGAQTTEPEPQPAP